MLLKIISELRYRESERLVDFAINSDEMSCAVELWNDTVVSMVGTFRR